MPPRQLTRWFAITQIFQQFFRAHSRLNIIYCHSYLLVQRPVSMEINTKDATRALNGFTDNGRHVAGRNYGLIYG